MATTNTNGQEKAVSPTDTKVKETLSTLDSLMKLRSNAVQDTLDDKKKGEQEPEEEGGLPGWEGTF